MKRKSIQVTLIFLISTVIQVLSNIVLTRLFGTSLEYSHFLAAVTLPTIFVTVIYGTLNDALLPLYGEKLANKDNDTDKFFFTQLNTLSLLSIFVAIMLNLLASPIMKQIFGQSNLSQSTLTNMFVVLNLAIPFSVIASILGMRLYAHKHFSRFPLAQLIGSVANLILVLVLFKSLGVWGLIYSFVISIIIQIFFVLPNKFQFKLGNIASTLALWVPLVVGIVALKCDSLIIRTFSSQLNPDSIIYHNLISKVCSLSAGLITIGIQILFLPNIIEKITQKDYQKTIDTVNKVKLSAIVLSLGLVGLIYFVSPFFIKILFVGGKFTSSDFNNAIVLLPYYLLPVLGWGIISVFLQPLYALKKHLQVGLLNTGSFAIAWLVASNISMASPNLAISVGLSILLFGSIIGSEILWQYSFNKLKNNK